MPPVAHDGGGRGARRLAAFLAVAGTSHFVVPGFYDRIVPHRLPGPPRGWTLVSGACELGVAAAVALPRTRRLGASLAAVLFVAVFPANVQMAVDYRHRSRPEFAGSIGRLPLQVPLVLWALHVRRQARPPA